MALNFPFTQQPHTFNGLRVVITPDRPKLQLSKDCPVTPEFRAEMNEWMLGFFGVSNDIPDGQYVQTNRQGQIPDVIFMNQSTYRSLEKSMYEHNMGVSHG